MIDPEVLAAFGLDADGLRKRFEGKRESRSAEVNALIDRMVARCRGGRDLNLERHLVFKALDDAWDVVFNQITPTLLNSLCDKSADSPEVVDILKMAGLDPSKVITEIKDPKTPGKSYKRVEVPAFFSITVPLCMAYVKIRQAKLVNDRKQVPFFKYEPVISDAISRMRCSLVTESIEQQSRQYGYFETFKQAIFQMLHYSECFQFPVEEWHCEYQWVEKKSPYPSAEDEEDNEKTIDKLAVKKIVTKEGLRYHLPHPYRTYYDRSYPIHTINTSTGCSYAGYWRVLKAADVLQQKAYYNLEFIGYDNFYAWFKGVKNHSYWSNTLKGCTLNFPGETEATGIVSKQDTEANVARWYSRDIADRPVVVTEHYERVIPKDVGLGDYDCPVWIRFVLAADDTVIYAAPVCYDPAIIFWGYDTVQNRTHNASMTLEVMPFQDQFSNLLSQHLLSVKQNLANLTLIDTEVIPEEQIKEIENLGERWWRKLNVLRVQFSKTLKAKLGSPGASANPLHDAIIGHKFPVQNTTETLQAMKIILDTLERVLVMSSQEVGQSASHEQTREEVRQISSNTSTRVQFTNTGVDNSIDAWKQQLYNAKMAYGQMTYYAQVPMDQPMSPKEIEQLGFTAKGAYDEKNRRQYIQGNSTSIKYESFVSDRDGQNRVNEIESAKVMLEVFNQAMQNPILAPAIGPDQGIKVLNQIARFLGFPRDFKLENTGQTQSMQDQVGQSIQQLQQFVEQSLASVQQDVKGALQNVMDVNKEQDGQLAQISQQLQQLIGGAQALPTPQLPSPSDLDSTVPATRDDLMSAGMIQV